MSVNGQNDCRARSNLVCQNDFVAAVYTKTSGQQNCYFQRQSFLQSAIEYLTSKSPMQANRSPNTA